MSARRYTKDDVGQHSDGFRERRPAVNVKARPWTVGEHFAAVAEENDDPSFVEWAEAQPDQTWDDYFQFACESGWEMLQSDAEEVFGPGVKVWSEGRSGGWAVVDGLPEFEDWDAVQLAKWRKFERWARATADGIPYDMAALAYINAYSAEQERRRQCESEWSAALLVSVGVSS